MRLLILSLDYQNVPLDLREKLTFSESELSSALLALYTSAGVFHEAALLSTCNRVAVVVVTADPNAATEAIERFLESWHGLPPARFRRYFRHHHDLSAVKYLMRVAAGLESLVPGEMQILGQVRGAAESARTAGTLGTRLGRLFDAAIRCGRRARNETGISRRAVSVSHAAVALAIEHFGDLAGKSFLLIGSGKMGEMAARQLRDAGAQHFIVANRSPERALAVAKRWGGTPVSLADVPDLLSRADAVITSTGAPHSILNANHVSSALASRQSRAPLLMIDLAVPRDIDSAVATLPGVQLYDLDHLQAVVDRNLAFRNGERDAVEAIVEEEVQKFAAWVRAHSVVPTISRLRMTAEKIRQAEVEKALRRLGPLGDQQREIIEVMTRGIINKLLHEPTVRLKEKAGDADGAEYEHVLSELFGLNSEGAAE